MSSAHMRFNRALEYDAGKKSIIIAYLAWFFLGSMGIHRMYLGRWFTGLAMLTLFIAGSMTTWILIGYVPLAALGLWWLLDGILTYVMTERYNESLAYQLRY